MELKYRLFTSSDDTNKIVLNTKGILVKKIHKRDINIKNDISAEVEFMTLLERDREKLEEGREEGIQLAKKIFKLLSAGESIENIAKICGISEEKVREIIE